MKRATTYLVFFLLWAGALSAQEQDAAPIVTGFVTRAASSSDFDVNATRIACGSETFTSEPGQREYVSGCPKERPWLGEAMKVYGSLKRKRNTVEATRIEIAAPAHKELTGAAVVDAAVEKGGTGAPASGLMVRADGYHILITPETKVDFAAPLKAEADIVANVWMQYTAKERDDGVLTAESAQFSPNVVTKAEEKVRKKVQYDPAAAAAQGRQSAFAAGFEGVDFHRIPPWTDAAMQKRVQTVGETLIPAWRTNLPDTDPAKIDFHFEVVNGNWGPFPVSLPNGVILIPHQAVERMQNDAQLAALLADCVATILEKQTFRMRNMMRTVTVGGAASQIATFIPGANLAGWAGMAAFGSGEVVILTKEINQSARVSLDLLHDAGYDLSQAPIAWWLLPARKAKPLEDLPMPLQTVTLYRTLGAVWRAAEPASAPTAAAEPATATQ